MAEAAVSFALEQVLEFLKEKATILRGVHREFAVIKDELESIVAFLKDAERKAADEGNSSDGIKTWVKQLREVSFRIEDVIAEYNFYVAQGTRHPGFLKRISHKIKTVKPLYRIASEIQEIKSDVHEIRKRGKSYNLQSLLEHGSSSNLSSKWHDPRLASLFIEETEVVGFENPRDQLVSWLVNGEATRTVVSVVGMGGLGKTTLARTVFDNHRVKGHFDVRALITVSQTYTVEALLRNILEQFYKETNKPLPQGINTMDTVSLVTEMRHYLQEKRYVIVFDDIWNVNFWDEFQFATIDNKLGSRIIITTRNLDVANYCKKSSLVQVHELQPLPQKKAWELFCKKAFQFHSDGNCSPELEDMSNEIVKICQGLPLAIVAIGGLLSTKDKTLFEWKKIYQNLNFELERNPHLTSLTRILALSYDDLPYYLKSCILYFGIYPEDYSIKCMRLVRQWIAEGFIIYEGEKALEEVAQQYLTELIHRSLVQVSKFDYEGKASSCRVHDMLRQTIITKIKELSFCHVVHEDDQPTPNVTARRLAIATSSSDALRTIAQSSQIRSMYIFGATRLPDDFLSWFFAKSRLLKVLDLEGTSLNYVPNDLGNIFHLRYLSLRKTNVKCIPKSIGRLQNLETLDLKETQVHELPSEINKLKKLRHLLVYYRERIFTTDVHGETGVRLQGSIGNLTCLQKLYHVDADHGGSQLIVELKKLRQLRKLGLKEVRREFGNTLCDSIQEMNCLESLSVSATSEDEIIDLQFITSLPQLQKLHLFGCLEMLPEWVSRQECLVRLSFRYSKLKDDPLKSLKDLPNLLRLSISGEAYVGETLHFQLGFQKLKTLYVINLKKLNSIVIDSGALPALQRTQLMRLPQLKEMPSSFHLLQSLETLYLTDMPHEFNQSIDPNHGPKYWVIKHVQVVSIRERVGPHPFHYNYRTIHHSRDMKYI